MSWFYLTKDEDSTITALEEEIRYEYYDIIPAEYWNGQLVTPAYPIGRNPISFCKKVRVKTGLLHTSPVSKSIDITFDEFINFAELVKRWKKKMPELEYSEIRQKELIGDNLWY